MDNPQHQLRFVGLLNALAQDATAIYLLGDIFDFWSEYVWRDKSKEEYSPLLDCLKELTGQRTGVTVHRAPEVTVVAGKRCMLAHGDGLVPKEYIKQFSKEIQRKIRSFMRLRRLFHNPVAQALFRLVPPALGNRLGYNWARKSRLKELANPCGYKGENREELVLYAKDQEQNRHLDYYIFGHRHIELDLELATGARVVILGDCFRQWTYAAMDEQGKLELQCIQEQNN